MPYPDNFPVNTTSDAYPSVEVEQKTGNRSGLLNVDGYVCYTTPSLRQSTSDAPPVGLSRMRPMESTLESWVEDLTHLPIESSCPTYDSLVSRIKRC